MTMNNMSKCIVLHHLMKLSLNTPHISSVNNNKVCILRKDQQGGWSRTEYEVMHAQVD